MTARELIEGIGAVPEKDNYRIESYRIKEDQLIYEELAELQKRGFKLYFRRGYVEVYPPRNWDDNI